MPLWTGNAAQRNTIVASKIWNDLFSLTSITTTGVNGGAGDNMNLYYPETKFEYSMQIGSKLYPKYPIRSHAEAYDQLRTHIRPSVIIGSYDYDQTI